MSAGAESSVNVLGWHNDHARTGQNLNETQLTLANVNSATFGKLFSYSVDGYVYAQPLCLSRVNVPNRGIRHLVFVATEHDSVYAFDADDPRQENGGPVWQVRFANPEQGVTSVPTGDVGVTEPSELGITGTPVIDPNTGTLYVVAHTKEVVSGTMTYPQRLHALDVATGEEKYGGPVPVQASVPGMGENANAQGQVIFDEQYDFQRSGLSLVNGVVYVAFASAGDQGPYHGWVLGFDAHTLQLTQVFNATPNGSEGGIWMSGAAPSIDTQGDIYLITGNGDFDPSVSNFGDSFLKLTPANSKLAVADYFAPFDQAHLQAVDGDLGSAAAMLLPDSVGSSLHPHLLVGCGKEGTVYLVDRDNLGHFNAADDSQIVQSLSGVIPGCWGSPAFYNGWVYYQGNADLLKAFSISNAVLSTQPASQNSKSQWGYPNGTPSISADGMSNAIVWLLQTDTFYQGAPAILHAYNATNLDQELYNSAQAGTRDLPGGVAQKFSVPVVANGKVYVGSGSSLDVFGILESPLITLQPASQAVPPGSVAVLSVAATGSPPLAYQWQVNGADLSGATNAQLILTGLTSDQTGSYTVQVANALGTASSTAATLLVVTAPSLSIDSDQQILLTGPAGVTYQIEYQESASGAQDWLPLLQLVVEGDPSLPDTAQAIFNDPLPTAQQRFYRASVIPTLPAELIRTGKAVSH